jgi:hypothetical protein
MNQAVLAAGASAEGVPWQVRGGVQQNGEFATFLWVHTAQGIVGGGGHQGPSLEPGAAISISLHRWWPDTTPSEGIHYVVGRVRADVALVRLHLAGARVLTRELRASAPTTDSQLAFVADILPNEADVVRIVALGGGGNLLEDRDWPARGRLMRERPPSG